MQNNNDMTIVVDKRTKIENILDCPFDHKAPSKQSIKITEIDNIADFTLVSVMGKVNIRSEETEVKVQERSVTEFTLWDKNIPQKF